MANLIKTFIEALLGQNHSDSEETKTAENLGTIVANNAAIRLGYKDRVHIDAEKARRAAEETAKRKKARGVDKGTER